MSRYNDELYDAIDDVTFTITDTQVQQFVADQPKHYIEIAEWPELVAALAGLVTDTTLEQNRYIPRVFDSKDKVSFTFDPVTQVFTQTAVGVLIHVFSLEDWTELMTEIEDRLANA